MNSERNQLEEKFKQLQQMQSQLASIIPQKEIQQHQQYQQQGNTPGLRKQQSSSPTNLQHPNQMFQQQQFQQEKQQQSSGFPNPQQFGQQQNLRNFQSPQNNVGGGASIQHQLSPYQQDQRQSSPIAAKKNQKQTGQAVSQSQQNNSLNQPKYRQLPKEFQMLDSNQSWSEKKKYQQKAMQNSQNRNSNRPNSNRPNSSNYYNQAKVQDNNQPHNKINREGQIQNSQGDEEGKLEDPNFQQFNNDKFNNYDNNNNNNQQQYNKRPYNKRRGNNNEEDQPNSYKRYQGDNNNKKNNRDHSNFSVEEDQIVQENEKNKHQVFQTKIINEPTTFTKDQVPFQHFDGRKYTVLMVAEKPSIARSIAEGLSGQGGYTQRKGICKYSNIYEFYGKIFNKQAFFKVTSVIGHVYTTDFPLNYQDWRKIDPITLFDAPTVKKQTNPESQIVEHLQKESLGSSFLVLWLDNDKEGENICFEVLQICRPNLMKEEFQQIFRAKFSSITKDDIQFAFDGLVNGPNQNQSISVDARQIIDLKVGVSFSRFQTRYLIRKYTELNSKKITFGPCQTPTLQFCVSRHDEIRQFKSQPFYKPVIKSFINGNQIISLDWVNEKTFELEEAELIKQAVELNGSCVVISVENKDTSRIRPEALNTVHMLRLASQQVGLGPQNAMHVAEKLYLGGFITYPRTESTRYPASFDFNGVVRSISNYNQSPGLEQYSYQLLQKQGMQNPRPGKDEGDHPPITPTNKTPSGLNREEQNMYELIARHFLATISPDAKFFKKRVVFESGDYQFNLKGTACVNQGFLEILPWIKIHENEIPNFRQGDVLQVTSVEINIGRTMPPEYLSESDLISLMEKHGIGTDASMATHINNICERDYVQVVGQSRRLMPTQLGIALSHSYMQIDPELVAPDLRSQIEKSVDLIAKGVVKYEDVLKNVLELFKNKYIYFAQNIYKMENHFNSNFSSIESAIALAPPFVKCGKCRMDMKLLEQQYKVYCENCKFMYGLPRNSVYEPAENLYCPLDNSQLIFCTIKSKGITRKITICPVCYQRQPQIEDIDVGRYERTSCNLCTNNICQYSLVYNEISTCKHCKRNGKLVIDWPIDGKYTMTCNLCSFQYVICEDGQVLRGQTKCFSCSSFLIKITLNKSQKGYPSNEFQGCLFCDSYKAALIPIYPEEEAPQENIHHNKTNRFLSQIEGGPEKQNNTEQVNNNHNGNNYYNNNNNNNNKNHYNQFSNQDNNNNRNENGENKQKDFRPRPWQRKENNKFGKNSKGKESNENPQARNFKKKFSPRKPYKQRDQRDKEKENSIDNSNLNNRQQISEEGEINQEKQQPQQQQQQQQQFQQNNGGFRKNFKYTSNNKNYQKGAFQNSNLQDPVKILRKPISKQGMR